SPDGLGLVLLDLIVERLIDPGAPLLVAIDDTLLRRSGPRVWGAAWHHEAIGATPRRFAWGNNWVVAALVVRLPFLRRAAALPVLFRLQAKRKDGKHELAAQLIGLIATRYPQRRIDIVGDGHYTGPALVCRPNVTLTARLRADAALHELAPPRTGKRGRPRAMGARLPSLAQIAGEPATAWETAQVRRYGQTATLQIHRLTCLWYRSHRDRPLRVLLVRDPSSKEPYELALISTDLNASSAELVERFACRWSIEVAFEDAKQLVGVGEARNRTEQAVKRTAPFGLLCMSLTITWYALHGHSPTDVAEHRARAPWYRTKTNPSTADMLAKLRRTIIAAQYSPGPLRDPYRQKINAIQQALAAALP
ncbi:MAG: IS701 family transposase, partial [Solirubrobacteraceae bacterium]